MERGRRKIGQDNFSTLFRNRWVEYARAKKKAIVFEEITGLRRLFRGGNRAGRFFRARMSSWPFYEIKRQIEYKAAGRVFP
jgi:IS605 OrfB family transposase